MKQYMKKAAADYLKLSDKALAAYTQIDDAMAILVINTMTGIYYIWNGMDIYDEVGTIEDLNAYYEEMYDVYGLGEDDEED